MRDRRVLAAVGVGTAALTALLTGCAPWLAANPQFASDSAHNPAGAPTSAKPAGGPPDIAAPKNDLAWKDCTSKVFGDAGTPAAPGVILECANYDADLDPIAGANGKITIGVVRARSVQTPPDAGPLVFTTGTDMPSSLQLPVWLTRSGTDVLKTHPVVSVDRRGIGMSSPVDCRDAFDRQEMRDQAQFESGDDPVANLGAITMTATTGCTDTIAPGDSAYDNARAAEDLERLRSTWDVPSLALIGVGNGAQIALAYAGSHPDKVARLVLDSPIPAGISAEAEAEDQVKSQQGALDAFAAQCVAVNCALGPDPKGAVDSLLSAARAGKGPGGVSVAVLANAIVTALGYPSGDRIGSTVSLANVLAAARNGDTNPLNSLINQAEATRDSDGQFINSCSDALNRPTPDRVRELVVAWGKLYPQFGTVGALDLVKCLNWPSGAAPKDPKNLKVNVLLMGVQNDPIAGGQGVPASAATIINAGAASKRVMWQGIGHGASIYSDCALPPMISYLSTGNLPPTDTYCPA
ncbi:alpha/beta fold hydrolase [Mycobacterium sp. DL592]|uniref:alpha/beta fold hydrolase n=1 Tax=Mycobacterium sp. DL592 TaxID=2675524 RepID=UPI0014204CDA|nr:alpha/beta fold hydrolase [Mycobacterium sp. DL592]